MNNSITHLGTERKSSSSNSTADAATVGKTVFVYILVMTKQMRLLLTALKTYNGRVFIIISFPFCTFFEHDNNNNSNVRVPTK